MKKRLFIFSFKFFLIKLLLIIGILYFIQNLFLNEIFLRSKFRLNQLFNGDYKSTKKIILGNSRSFSLIFENKNLEILNFSFNEMTFENIEQILEAIKLNSTDKKVYLEITSLIDDDYNCSYHIFNFHKYFDKQILQKNCKLEYFLTNYFFPFRLNSELFYRTFYYYLIGRDDQNYVNKNVYNYSVCENNKFGFYDPIFSNEESINKIISKIDKLNQNFYELRLEFFILPYHKASREILQKFESKLYERLNGKILKLNQKIESNFYEDCNNFLDRIHLSEKGISKIDFKNNIK